MTAVRVIRGRSEAQTRESPDERTLVSEMVGSSPTMTCPYPAMRPKSATARVASRS
jgi:hypothetical protein